MSCFADLYAALWNATEDRYAAQHDVSQESRDHDGQWTTGGKTKGSDVGPQSDRATLGQGKEKHETDKSDNKAKLRNGQKMKPSQAETIESNGKTIGTIRKVAQRQSGAIGTGYKMDTGYHAKRGRFDTGLILKTREEAIAWLESSATE
jgi:hypothetical protein